jgi:hypothetical protein
MCDEEGHVRRDSKRDSGLGGAQVEDTADGAGASRWEDAATVNFLAAIYS